MLDGTESNGKFELDTEEAKRVFDEMLSEEGDLSSALSTTEAKSTTTKSDSFSIFFKEYNDRDSEFNKNLRTCRKMER